MSIGFKTNKIIDLPYDKEVVGDCNIDEDIVKDSIDYNYLINNYFESNNFITKDNECIPYGNLLRMMTDDQLRELFEEGDVPTNSDFIAIIDSKLNKQDAANKEEIDKNLLNMGQSLNNKADKKDTYTKGEVDGFIKNTTSIDDSSTSTSKVWSSNKTSVEVGKVTSELNKVKVSLESTDGIAREAWVNTKTNETSILNLEKQLGTQISRAKGILTSLSSKLD